MTSSKKSNLSKVQALEAVSVTVTDIGVGARGYSFHAVLHEYPYDECLLTLRNIAAAMTPGYSKLLLNEHVLQDLGCPWQPTIMDLKMLTTCSGMERTEEQWQTLIADAGLKVINIWRLEDDTEAVIEIGK